MTSFGDFIESFKQIEPLSNFQISDICRHLKLKHFIGVFMRDELDSIPPHEHCLILNLDLSINEGTHWTCLFVTKDKCIYFDPFGFCPPPEIEKYCGKIENRIYSTFPIQKANSVICGHYIFCGQDVFSITDELYNY